VQLDEQGGALGETEVGPLVARRHLDLVQHFDASHRDAELDAFDRGLHGVVHAWKAANCCRDHIWHRVDAEPKLRDHPERSFRTDEQSGEVVTGA
jgi:hypothetical protein